MLFTDLFSEEAHDVDVFWVRVRIVVIIDLPQSFEFLVINVRIEVVFSVSCDHSQATLHLIFPRLSAGALALPGPAGAPGAPVGRRSRSVDDGLAYRAESRSHPRLPDHAFVIFHVVFVDNEHPARFFGGLSLFVSVAPLPLSVRQWCWSLRASRFADDFHWVRVIFSFVIC